ncbi:endonuclease/exonuclease/phosphatase family protein [Microbulbifer sp. 2205BS26-8]|uniref:endonuclease/exonuclease/phosphatase family protein n=1 Tax=Microbulbifer sp. 2205BS26-8 TaxID=3064386 RepID=UPI00273EC9E8|nr:endonuclease/exonuclease/phosphatase family protein [Microbulbifer sp. 2205BS26-8]MDP5211018.1 endonuclease/exonuclease/phosphatase family protein [Microbulbifer sp. 2205BS26-8]
MKQLMIKYSSFILLLSIEIVAQENCLKDNEDYITLINWNAWELGQYNNYPYYEVRKRLLDLNPDILTIQEVKRCGFGFYSLLRDDIDFNDENMWCAEKYAYPGKGNGAAGSYGIGIASKYPTLKSKIIKEINGRTVLGVKYEVHNTPVWIWSAHAAFVKGPSDTTRLEDFHAINEIINLHNTNSEPVILSGDFNADRDRPWGENDPERGEMAVFWDNGFKDVWREVYPDIETKPGYTYYNISRIDYILTKNLPKNWSISDIRVLDNIWCDIGVDNRSKDINCDKEESVDHNPIYLKIKVLEDSYDYAFPDGIRNYKAGTKVLSKDGNVYQCRSFPYSGYCKQWNIGANQYEPGKGIHWHMAWEKIDP